MATNSCSPFNRKRDVKSGRKKEEEMVIKSAKEQWEVIKSQNKRSSNQQMLRAFFRPDWIERVDF
jgi:hypothetical protein